MFYKTVEFMFPPDSLPKIRKTGVIRIPARHSKCPGCDSYFVCIDDRGYLCPDCHTTPDRFYLDIHYRGKRVRVFCDRQGKPLDTNQRAYDLLAHINCEIESNRFDPSIYVKAEQKELYASVKLDEYFNHKINSIAPSYQTDFKRYIRIAKEFFGIRDVREIRKIDIISYQKYLQVNFKVSNKTIKNIVDVFKAFLNYLKNDLEVINVVPNFPHIEIDIKPFKWLSQEDQISLFELVPDKHKPIIGFLMLHGCRPSEARALKNKNVDLKNNIITISATFSGNVYREKRKGKRSRPVTIPIHPELYGYISTSVLNNLPEAFVFINPTTGKYYHKNTLQRIWNNVRETAGIDKGLRLYDATRHSFASNLVNSGSTIYKVSKLLGHSSVKMTEKYAHSEVENLRTDIQKLSLKRQQTVSKKVLYVKK
jgi:integrase